MICSTKLSFKIDILEKFKVLQRSNSSVPDNDAKKNII